MAEIRTLDTGTEYLLARVEDGVGVVTFNRPERLNALHPDMFVGFSQVLPAFANDDEVGAVLLTGAGRGFCAGGDVRAQSERAERVATGAEGSDGPSLEDRVQDLRQRQAEVSAAIFEFPKVTIAALPGPAAGAGLSIALSCDLRVAAPTAMITTAFAKVGFSGDFGGSWFLTRLVGLAKATELYLTSDKVSAEEAVRLGIVNAAAARRRLPGRGARLRRHVRQRPPRRLPLHEGEPAPGTGGRPAHGAQRRGRGHDPHGRHGGPPGGGPGVRGEADALLHRSLTVLTPARHRRAFDLDLRSRVVRAQPGRRLRWSVPAPRLGSHAGSGGIETSGAGSTRKDGGWIFDWTARPPS